MESDSPNHPLAAVLQEIEVVEGELGAHLASTKKLKDRLAKARQEMAKGRPVARLASLVAELRAADQGVGGPDVRRIAETLERHVPALSASYGGSFGSNLRRVAESQRIPFRQIADGFGVGPFALIVDAAKEAAALHYAKVPVAKDLPLDPELIVTQVRELAERLLQEPSLPALRSQVEEAMRVAVARQQKKPGTAGRHELRVELPAAYREMCFIRQTPGKDAAKAEYSISRFVVELKTLVQSDDNTRGDRRFRLETAVLENTKDPRKSVFFPNDLAVGFGEGTYYQAILLVTPA